ncbi:L-ascorbate oxidase homolog [Salvia miltiorrhiza]|uniref:L-ascorbate oxidase homolog n=1 Tax=Salvia miltiorrhiza TaxID=226208 RepID=UPI0025AC6D64|nr:L-ascorbate oxidase homolog [Salvia miltiorrhiza]
MGSATILSLIWIVGFLSVASVSAEDAYKYYTWTVTYGTAAPLGVPQQVILINGQFPGPNLDCVTNDNIILNLINKLDQPFLLTWNGIKQRKNSWQDGVLGTNCPIPPNSNYTYKFQAKDQIGSYTYFPSTLMHRAAGAFGALNVYARSVIPVPYAPPAADFTLLIGDWYAATHNVLQQTLDSGSPLPSPDAILINGRNASTITGDPGKTYMFRVSNVGLATSFNWRIEGHQMKVVEIEGSHVIQNTYDSVDVHVGQTVTVLVSLDQPPRDYRILASTRFTLNLTATALLHYSNSEGPGVGSQQDLAPRGVEWSVQQARSCRWNLTANAARPNPQGSFHYGQINISRSIFVVNSAPLINGKQRYAVNGMSYVQPDTPLKLADYLNISGVFSLNATGELGTAVVGAALHDFVEIVFENEEETIQTWHLDGYDFWVVGMGAGKWRESSREGYNLVDAVTRHTTQVYPRYWSAVLVSLDNQGMWNLRSAMWGRQYLGQQLYIRVYDPIKSLANEYDMPANALLCARALHPL